MIFNREAPENRLCGIYMILNTITGEFYIGQTSARRGFIERWRKHANEARRGKGCRHLRNAYLKYGPESFFTWALEVLPRDKILLTEREQFYVDELKPAYNIATECVSSKLGIGHSAETREKISRTLTRRKLGPQTAEHKKKIGDSNRGKKMDPEIVKRVAAKLTGRKQTPEHIANSSTARRGKGLGPRSESAKAAMRLGWARWRADHGR